MGIKLKFIIPFLSLGLLSCSDKKISSNYKVAPLICGSSKVKATDKIIKIYDSKGEPIKGEEFDQITFKKRELAITDQGCVVIPKGEGALFVKVYSKRKKEMINLSLPEFEPGRIKKIDLLPFASVEDKFEGKFIKDIIFENICSSTPQENETFYTKEHYYLFKVLSHKKFNLKGLNVSLKYHNLTSPSLQKQEFDRSLEKLVGKPQSIPLNTNKKLILDIDLKDSFQAKTSLQTHRCTLVRITDRPILKRINSFRVFKNQIPLIGEPLSLALEIQEKIHLQSVSFKTEEKTVEFKNSLNNRFSGGTYTFPIKDIPFLNENIAAQIEFTLKLTDRIGNFSTTKIKMRKKDVYSLSKSFPTLENPSMKFSPSLNTLLLNGKDRPILKSYDMTRFNTLSKKQIQLIDAPPPESIIILKKNQSLLKSRLLDDKRIAIILGDQEGRLERFSLYHHDGSSWKEQKGFDLKRFEIRNNINEKNWITTSLSLSPKGDKISYITKDLQKIKLISFKDELIEQTLRLYFHGGIFQQFFDDKGDFIIFSDRHGSVGHAPVESFSQTKGHYLRDSGFEELHFYGPLSKGHYLIHRKSSLYKMNPQENEDFNLSKIDFCFHLKETCKEEGKLHLLGHNEQTLALGMSFDRAHKKKSSKKLILFNYKKWVVNPKEWDLDQKIPWDFKYSLKKVSLSKDNRTLLVAFKKNNLVSIIDRSSRKILKTYAHSSEVVSLKWTKSGQALSLSKEGHVILTNPKREFAPITLDNIDYLTPFSGDLLFYHQDQKKILHHLKTNKKVLLSLDKDDTGEKLGLFKKNNFLFVMGKNKTGGLSSNFATTHKLFIITPDFQVKTWKKTVAQFKFRKEGENSSFLLFHGDQTTSFLSFDAKTKSFVSFKEFKAEEASVLKYRPSAKQNDRLSLDFIHKNKSQTQAILSFTNHTRKCVPSVRAHIPGDVCHDEIQSIVTLYDLKNKKVIEEIKIQAWPSKQVPSYTQNGTLWIKGLFKVKMKETYAKGDLQTLEWENVFTSTNSLRVEGPSLLREENIEDWKKDDHSDFFSIHSSNEGELQIKRKKSEEIKKLIFHQQELLTKRFHPNGHFLFLKIEEDAGIFLKVLDLETLNIVERFLLDESGLDEDSPVSGFTPEGDFFINVVVKNGKKSARIYPLNFFKQNTFFEHTKR